MKNIHLLPTDKPSRLHLWTDENGTRPALCELEYSHTRNTQHIYITCDEEIKEGDWQLSNDKHITIRTDSFHESDKKIILTTDKDLIKDGVQAIDDEFLQWFVQNPSCEEVEVMTDAFTVKEMSMLPIGTRNLKYKIIIPKEEPKQGYVKSETEFLGIEFTLKDGSKQFVPNLKEEPKQEQEVCNHCGKTLREQMKGCGEITCYRQFLSKQETLEEAGAIAAGLCEHLEAKEQAMFIAGFQECLKLQQERSYSEEDMAESFMACWKANVPEGFECKLSFKEWLEQFKKK